MRAAKGKPILGGVLGGLAALVFILILAFGAVVPPTQFVVWTLLGLGVLVGALALSVVVKTTKFIVMLVIAVLIIGWGAVGIPSHNGTGDLAGGCNLEGYSFDEFGIPLDAGTPQDTSASDPFVIEPTGSIEWMGNTPGAFEGWTGWLKVDFGGIPIPVWNSGHDNSGLDPDEEGTVDVGEQLEAIEDATGITLSGVFLLYGNISSEDGSCDMDAYLELPADGLFSGVILITLWIILVVIIVVVIILMVPVCAARKALRAGDIAAPTDGGAGGGADVVGDATGGDEAKAVPAAKKSAAKKPPASGGGAKKK